MRVLGVTIVALAVAILVTMWLVRADSSRAILDTAGAGDIHVTGTGNTLALIAAQVNDPARFVYDAANGTATTYCDLVIEGELQLGREGDVDSGECLALATQVCGDLRIRVLATGVLRLYHSSLRTVSQVLSNSACSQGYALFVDGTLVMEDSRITYLSGSASQCLRNDARATIRNSSFSLCDGSALSCVDVDGSGIVIEDTDIRGSGNWGLVVRGRGGAPLEIRDSVFESQLGDVFMTGESPSVRLVDCTFDRSKIVFNRRSGQVAVAWTRRFKVTDAKTQLPRTGVLVRAEDSGETVEARTDSDGQVELALTEWIARPGGRAGLGVEGKTVVQTISVIDDNGKLLTTIRDFVARGKEPGAQIPIVLD